MARAVLYVALLSVPSGQTGCGDRSRRAEVPSTTTPPAQRDGGFPDSGVSSAPGRTPCNYVEQQLPELQGTTCPAPNTAISKRLAPLLRTLAANPKVKATVTSACAVGDSWIAEALFERPDLPADENGAPPYAPWATAVRVPATGAPTSLGGGVLMVLDLDGDGTGEPVTGTPTDLTIWFAAGAVRFEVPAHLTGTWTVHSGRPALLVSDVDSNQDHNPFLGFSKVNSKAYTFTPGGAQEQPSIVTALWQHSRGAHCPGTVSDDVGQFEIAQPVRLKSAPSAAKCDPASDGDRRALLAAILQRRRLIAAEKGTHDNYTSVEWLCRIDHQPTAWVSSQFLGHELWELSATGAKASSFGKLHDNQIVRLLGSADFDGDGSAHLIFAFERPLSGPPYDTEIKVRYRDRMQTIARSGTSQPEPVWQVIRLPGGNQDGFMFYAGTDWNWERTAPQVIVTENGRFVDLPSKDKRFLIEATASERLTLRQRVVE